MKIKENEMQTFALLRKVCGNTISGGGGELSAWYIEKYKRKCNLHTFAYETLFFYVILLGN